MDGITINLKMVTSLWLVLLFSFIFIGCSKEHSDLKLRAYEATELEKSAEFFPLLHQVAGVHDVQYGADSTIESALVTARAPIRGSRVQAGILASQQATIWKACSELAGWIRSDVGVGERKGELTHTQKSKVNLKGIRLLYLNTDMHQKEVTAILRWKPRSSSAEASDLPPITIWTNKESSEETIQTISGENRGKNSEHGIAEKIFVNGVLVIDEIIMTSGATIVTEYRQFFENGKPNLEEVLRTEDGSNTGKVKGTVWNRQGVRISYSE